MTKPFDIKELLARITVQLRKNEIQTEKHSLSIGNLSGLSMNVPKDSIYGFVKKNDAGNPLIRLICGLQDCSGKSLISRK